MEVKFNKKKYDKWIRTRDKVRLRAKAQRDRDEKYHIREAVLTLLRTFENKSKITSQ